MHKTASEFAEETFQADKRSGMVEASRELLLAVTRLMVVADVLDVNKLLKASRRVRPCCPPPPPPPPLFLDC